MEGTSWHSYQLAEQKVKIHMGTAWQLLDMRWLTPAKTGYDFEINKMGTTCRWYKFAWVQLDLYSSD